MDNQQTELGPEQMTSGDLMGFLRATNVFYFKGFWWIMRKGWNPGVLMLPTPNDEGSEEVP